MEKQIKVIARYHYEHDYYVEVESEDSVIASRDYWLCKRGSARKLFMFSSPYTDEKTEERKILSRIREAVETFAATDASIRYA